MSQITTSSFFRVEGFSNKWWAFKQMQLGLSAVKKSPGLTFAKLLGSGGKNGFSSIPNFGVYVLFCVWESEEKSKVFFETNSFFKKYKTISTEQFTIYLHATESHGHWDGLQPFEKTYTLAADKPVMVLTRASIHLHKLLSFWRRVAKVSHSLEPYQGLVLSVGVGEWPLIQQATLSLWKTQAEMLDYAYKNPKHKEVVLLTRKLNWYREELFVRFVPYRLEGTWEGKDVGNLLERGFGE
jgi:hypothetical protein